MNSNQFLDLIQPEENTSPFRMATIDPSHSSGKPKVVFDGEAAASAKRYSYLLNYMPAAGDRVLLAQVSGTYVILGRVV